MSTASVPAPGLRERKKQATRRHIAAIATTLFATQGFEATTIAQIAGEAEVAKMTVTNYFPLKEDLLFDRAPEIIAMLADAVRAREPGTTPLDAVRGVYRARLDERWPALAIVGSAFFATVDASPALRARERSMFAEQEDALADVLVAEARAGGRVDEVPARIEAARLAGAVRVLYFEGRRRVQAGQDVDTVVAALERAARDAFRR